MKIYRLDNPWALFFLLLPILCLITIIISKFIFKKGVKITGVSEFEKGISIFSYGYYFTLFLIISGMFIVAFSLTKPQYGIKKEKIISEGIDIIIALDTSGSMTRPDFFQQTRIEGAKKILVKFVDKRKGDRIGLVTFADSSFLKCPATINFNLLKSVINRIYIDPRQQRLTAIGIGLASAINRLLKIKDDVKLTSKIVILVTDGVNNTGEISPQAAIEIAAQTGIKVYTVGIGSSQEVDLDLLKTIADKTNGTFFHAKTSGDLGPVFEEINKLEKHKIETLEFTRFKNVGYKYAYLGIMLLIFGLLLNTIFFKRLS
ncbi:MAG: VWA domain-containing protein [Spirochaetes bacterium]|nr:VWA domain-containing protein [Spirochaetota bacterium]